MFANVISIPNSEPPPPPKKNFYLTTRDFPNNIIQVNQLMIDNPVVTHSSQPCVPSSSAGRSVLTQTNPELQSHPSSRWLTSPSQLGFHPRRFVRSTAQTPTVLAFVNMRHAFLNAIPTYSQWEVFRDGKGWSSTRILHIDTIHLNSEMECWPQRFQSYRQIWKIFLIYHY